MKVGVRLGRRREKEGKLLGTINLKRKYREVPNMTSLAQVNEGNFTVEVDGEDSKRVGRTKEWRLNVIEFSEEQRTEQTGNQIGSGVTV